MLLLPWDKYFHLSNLYCAMSRTFPKVWSTLPDQKYIRRIRRDHKLVPRKYLHALSSHRVWGLFFAAGTWEVSDLRKGHDHRSQKCSSAQFFLASCTIRYNTVPSVLKLIAWRSETFHFLGFLNALIDREYPCCQSKWASCPRLGGDCCSSTEASCLVIQLPWSPVTSKQVYQVIKK